MKFGKYMTNGIWYMTQALYGLHDKEGNSLLRAWNQSIFSKLIAQLLTEQHNDWKNQL